MKLRVNCFGSFGVLRPQYVNMGWVLAYDPGRRIALRLRLSDAEEAMFLLMDEEIQTIGDAIAQVGKLGSNAQNPNSPLDADDTVLIPSLELSHHANFLPLLNGEFRSDKAPVDLRFNAALQTIQLKLNDKGMDMETRSFLIPPSFLGSGDHSVPIGERVERRMVFNRPFYLLLWRKGGTHPYLAAYVAQGGLVAVE